MNSSGTQRRDRAGISPGFPSKTSAFMLIFDEHLHPNLPVSTCQSGFVERVHFFARLGIICIIYYVFAKGLIF